MTESLTPSCSSDNDSIASAEDDDPPTTVCGREEPLEGCQLTDLRKTYSDNPAAWKITQELIDHFTRNPPSQNHRTPEILCSSWTGWCILHQLEMLIVMYVSYSGAEVIAVL